MKKVIFVLVFLSLTRLSSGQLVTFNATLDGPQSNTPSLGTGTAVATLDLLTNFFTLDYMFSGLLAPQTAAHIHRGAPGVNGPIIIGAPTFPLGSPIHFETTVSSLVAGDLLNNNTYLNIHSSDFRGGEIRGQLIAAVPEPSTYALGMIALLSVVVGWRKRLAWTRREALPA